MKELDIQPCVHILDYKKVLVSLDNDNYENSSVFKIDKENMTVCQDIVKLATTRGKWQKHPTPRRRRKAITGLIIPFYLFIPKSTP